MNRKTFLAGLCLTSLTLAFGNEPVKPSEHYVAGQTDARTDLKAGKLAVETFGLLVYYHGTYRDLLKERYGIEVRAVAGCVVNSRILDHARGYNEIMNAEITRRFGEDVFTRTLQDAEEIARKERS